MFLWTQPLRQQHTKQSELQLLHMKERIEEKSSQSFRMDQNTASLRILFAYCTTVKRVDLIESRKVRQQRIP